jgi:hypothetical protein
MQGAAAVATALCAVRSVPLQWMQTPRRGVATTVMAGVPPARAKKLQPARLPLQLDRCFAVATATHRRRGVLDHGEVTVSAAESDELVARGYPSV